MMNINPENIIGDIKGVIIVTAAILLIGLICKLISIMSESAQNRAAQADFRDSAEAPDNDLPGEG